MLVYERSGGVSSQALIDGSVWGTVPVGAQHGGVDGLTSSSLGQVRWEAE